MGHGCSGYTYALSLVERACLSITTAAQSSDQRREESNKAMSENETESEEADAVLDGTATSDAALSLVEQNMQQQDVREGERLRVTIRRFTLNDRYRRSFSAIKLPHHPSYPGVVFYQEISREDEVAMHILAVRASDILKEEPEALFEQRNRERWRQRAKDRRCSKDRSASESSRD